MRSQPAAKGDAYLGLWCTKELYEGIDMVIRRATDEHWFWSIGSRT
jgi:hypothetical protein